MSTKRQESSGFVTLETNPLDEAVWQAWLAKGRARDNRGRARLNAAIRYVVIAVLLVAAGVWSSVAPYDVMIRFVVTAGAIFLMAQALRSANYAFSGFYGAVGLLFNPVSPAFTFAGEWQRMLVLGSALLFMASFYRQAHRPVHHA
jgi:hypothetical protein